MKAKIDLIQEKQIRLLFYLVGILGATTTLVLYFQNKKVRAEKSELTEMEKELTALQLEKLKREKLRNYRR